MLMKQKPSQTRYDALLSHYLYLADPQSLPKRKRGRAICRARWRTWRELHEQGFSYPGIGMAAKRHHTTVLHGVRKIVAIDSEVIHNPVLEWLAQAAE